MKLEYRNGLLFTSIEIKHRKKSKIIDNIVIDTGAAETIISPDAVYDMVFMLNKMISCSILWC